MATRTAAPRPRTTRTTDREPAAQHGADQDHGDADKLQQAPGLIEPGWEPDPDAQESAATVDDPRGETGGVVARLVAKVRARGRLAEAHEAAKEKHREEQRRREETSALLDQAVSDASRAVAATRRELAEADGARDALLVMAPDEMRERLRAARGVYNLAGGVVGRAQMALDAADRQLLQINAPVIDADRAVVRARGEVANLKSQPTPRDEPGQLKRRDDIRNAEARAEMAVKALKDAADGRSMAAVREAEKALAAANTELQKARKEEQAALAAWKTLEDECLAAVSGG